MVLLEEDPASLMKTTTQNFYIKSDIHALERITDQIQAIQKSRATAADESRNSLLALSRRLELAKATSTSLIDAHSNKDHSTTMLKLDREKFSLAKSINELESSTHTLDNKLSQLKEELEMVDAEDVLSDPKVVAEDDVLLKLKVYRSLGIEVEQDEDSPGVFAKAIVRNPGKGDVHVVRIESRVSRFFYANYFWSVL